VATTVKVGCQRKSFVAMFGKSRRVKVDITAFCFPASALCLPCVLPASETASGIGDGGSPFHTLLAENFHFFFLFELACGSTR
jgi:hypothetical protein